jgi:dTDP-4-amino-4,6-dideoxygalactose transaminase
MIAHSKPWLLAEDAAALVKVVASGWLVGGPGRTAAKQALAATTGAEDALLFPSGRVALVAALRAMALPAGAGVMVQAYACDAVAWAIRSAGLTPVLCDLQDGWTCGPSSVAEALSDQVRALILAPPFGLFQSAEPFRAFGLPIVHDLCQANPALLADRWADAGDLAVVSFHPTKYAGTSGGGAVLSNRAAYRAALTALEAEWDAAAPVGELSAAMITSQLDRIGAIRTRRDQIARAFRAAMPPAWTGALAAAADVHDRDLFRFPLRIDGLDFVRAQAHCGEQGVAVRRGVDRILPDAQGRRFAKAEAAFGSTLSIPFYPALSDEDVERVLAVVADLA